jgi:hypothetical protein
MKSLIIKYFLSIGSLWLLLLNARRSFNALEHNPKFIPFVFGNVIIYWLLSLWIIWIFYPTKEKK